MIMHHREWGTGPPLIILHGLFGSADNWQSVALALRDAFRVFAVDQRDHGRSFHSDGITYTAMADDLARFMDAHALESAHLLGHSMGGKTAMQFAVTHPARVTSLIVVDVAPKTYPPRYIELAEAMLDIDPGRYRSRTEVDEALSAQVPNAKVRQFFLKNLARDDSRRLYWRANLPVLCRDYARVFSGLDTEGTCDRPALFVKGGKSGYLSDADWPLLRRLFPNAVVREIPAAGHWVHADCPDAFVEAVREFLGADEGAESAT